MAFDDVPIVRMRGDLRSEARDRVVVEAPLEIRLHGRPFAVIMRTPGQDRELAAGFLFSERVIASADDLTSIEPPGGRRRAATNILDVTLANTSAAHLDRLFGSRRNVVTNSSCGMCGRLTIESLGADLPVIAKSWSIGPERICDLPAQLRSGQQVFFATGGLHAAALFDRDGTLRLIAEDVGRHNAVDKVIGRML